jgi:hypothetical protein
MKIGFYCESPVDAAAMKIFTAGILKQMPEEINMPLNGRGVPDFFIALDGVFRGIHYLSDAEGLVIVVDSDESVVHNSGHDKPGASEEQCRLCKVRKIIANAQNTLKPRQNRAALKVAIGVAVPAIEAWYLTGINHQVGEAAWLTKTTDGRHLVQKKQLKRELYQTEDPPLNVAMECAVREATRLAADLQPVENVFPNGFGLMANEIRTWMSS